MKKIILSLLFLLFSFSLLAGTISSNEQVIIKSNVSRSVSNVMINLPKKDGGLRLKGFDFAGYYKNESETTNVSYNLSVGLTWRLCGNKTLTRININNDNGYEAIGALLKFNWNVLGDWFYPFLVIGDTVYNNYNGRSANRFLSGIGYSLKLFPNLKRFSLGVSAGINMTLESNTEILGGKASVFWWRGRAKFVLKISNWLDLKVDGVYAKPISDTGVWRYYVGSLVFKVRDNISLIVSVKDYDYRVLNLGKGLNKTLSVGVSL